MTTQSDAAIAGTRLDAEGLGLQVPTDLSNGLQTVEDIDGNQSPLQLSTSQVVVGPGDGQQSYPLTVLSGTSVRLDMGDSTTLSLGAPGTLSVDAVDVVAGRFVVNDDGFVGINQPAAAYNLDVQGTMRFQGLPQLSSASNPCPANLVVDVNTGIVYLNY